MSHVIRAAGRVCQPGDVLLPVIVVVLPGGDLDRRAGGLGLGHEGVRISDPGCGYDPFARQARRGMPASAHHSFEITEP